MKSFSPAQNPDVAAYRSWMDENAPIERLETRFLNHEQDLIALSNGPRESPATRPLLNPRHIMIIFGVLVLLPLLAFSFVLGFFARISVVLVVGCGALAVISSSGLADTLPLNEFAAGASMFVDLSRCRVAKMG